MLFYLDNLQITGKSVSLHCVFHSIRFKVNKRLEQGVAPFFMLIRLQGFGTLLLSKSENPGNH